jgi:hypothetical protein
MRRAVARSFGVGAFTLMIGVAAQLVYTAGFCPHHRAWERIQEHQSVIVRDVGYRYALPDESIYACTTPHRTGPIVWHEDVECYCAPASTDAAALGRLLAGDCLVDHLHATRNDDSGACRHAHCLDLNESP